VTSARGFSPPEDRPRRRSQERFAQRRDEVVDIAAGVFAQRGYHATTIDDLVEATNLQRGGLYYYIGGKKELLLNIHGRFIDPLLTDAREIAAGSEPADVRLRLIAKALMETIARFRDQVTVFMHEWRVIENDPEWTAVRQGRRDFESTIETILRDGRDAGVFEFADLRLTVLAFLGMFNHTYQWFDPDGRVTADALAGYFADIFLAGISPGARPAKSRKR
jgi:AcrR family transcriptional regulator